MAEKIQKTRDPVRRWTLITLGLIVVLFLYSIIADRMTPYTSQAVVQAFVVRVAPEVSGRVLEVGVTDNQKVNAGELLFRIDPEPYQIALKGAEAEVAECRADYRRQHRRGYVCAGTSHRSTRQPRQYRRAS